MTDYRNDQDTELGALFRAVAEPIADDGFSAQVVARLVRRDRRRQWLLAAAVLAGTVILAAATIRLPFAELSAALAALAAAGPAFLAAQPLVVGALLLGGLAGLFTAVLED